MFARYESLKSTSAAKGEKWFANIVSYIPSGPSDGHGRRLSLYGWWETALDTGAIGAYGMKPWALGSGARAWYVGAALLDEGAVPVEQDSAGVYAVSYTHLTLPTKA